MYSLVWQHHISPLLHRYSFKPINNRQLLKTLLLFPHCFLLNQKIVSPFVNIHDVISLFAAELEQPKIGM